MPGLTSTIIRLSFYFFENIYWYFQDNDDDDEDGEIDYNSLGGLMAAMNAHGVNETSDENKTSNSSQQTSTSSSVPSKIQDIVFQVMSILLITIFINLLIGKLKKNLGFSTVMQNKKLFY